MSKLNRIGIVVFFCCSQPCLGQLIIAHRGASYAAPENTLAAFRLAWRLGADGIEGDFHLSADGRIVCIHDEDTERVAGVKRSVKDTSFEELRKLDVGSWKSQAWQGERIPTLEEVLATVPRGKCVFVELKSGPEIVLPLRQILSQSVVPLENIAIISFDAETIQSCENQIKGIKTYWLTSYEQQQDTSWSPSADEVSATIARVNSDGLGSKAIPAHVDREFLDTLRARGVSDFHVWTVDTPRIGKFYQGLGAHAITTNRPAFMRSQLAKVAEAEPPAESYPGSEAGDNRPDQQINTPSSPAKQK